MDSHKAVPFLHDAQYLLHNQTLALPTLSSEAKTIQNRESAGGTFAFDFPEKL
jgi:hypothetical protein